jgi:uncharacterized protein YdiU (UPF0061 family)
MPSKKMSSKEIYRDRVSLIESSLNQLSFSSRFYALGDSFYSDVQPTPLKNPFWLHINTSVMSLLGLSLKSMETQSSLDNFIGKSPLPIKYLLPLFIQVTNLVTTQRA